MAEFIEVRTTIEGYERAATLSHRILGAGLATSIDIAEAPDPAGQPVWELTFITTGEAAATLEEQLRANGDGGAVISRPVAHDLDSYPDWLPDQP
ncbi:hypothetical protein ABZ897_08860 [Nonomuraea sp. NPDC046802]|uniref:hypothetical protein n=1 Tax=Nonomuraea sp. NPDC046802 TaxID=3154919 RepID=UPI0033D10598